MQRKNGRVEKACADRADHRAFDLISVVAVHRRRSFVVLRPSPLHRFLDRKVLADCGSSHGFLDCSNGRLWNGKPRTGGRLPRQSGSSWALEGNGPVIIGATAELARGMCAWAGSENKVGSLIHLWTSENVARAPDPLFQTTFWPPSWIPQEVLLQNRFPQPGPIFFRSPDAGRSPLRRLSLTSWPTSHIS
jgi:hypothetical protein